MSPLWHAWNDTLEIEQFRRPALRDDAGQESKMQMADRALATQSAGITFPFERPAIPQSSEYVELRGRPTLTRARLWDGKLVWLATRYDDVRTILADTRFSSSSEHENYPALSGSRVALVKAEKPVTMIRQDGADHNALRRIFASEFTHSRVSKLEPEMRSVIDQLADEMEEKGAPFELVKGFALAMPSRIIARVLGVPYEDHEFFEENSGKKIDLSITPEEALDAARKLREYLSDILKEKMRDPDRYDDLLTRIYVKHVATGDMSFDELLANVELLILAGHETTANMTALGALTLMQNPDAFRALHEDQDGTVIKPMVEELLRYLTIVHLFSGRVALDDVEVGGVTIRKGDGVIALIAPANHDPQRFPNPESFDYTRPRVPAHMAFGFGAHQCLGQTLARAELVIALPTLVKRFPNLHLATSYDALQFKGNTLTHGVVAMPVAW